MFSTYIILQAWGFSWTPSLTILESNPIPLWLLSPIYDTFRIGPSHPNKRYVPYGQPYLVEDGEGSSFTDRIWKEFFINIENSKPAVIWVLLVFETFPDWLQGVSLALNLSLSSRSSFNNLSIGLSFENKMKMNKNMKNFSFFNQDWILGSLTTVLIHFTVIY